LNGNDRMHTLGMNASRWVCHVDACGEVLMLVECRRVPLGTWQHVWWSPAIV